MMSKEKIKKIIFYIVLTPIIVLMTIGFINSIIGIFKHNHWDLYTVIEPILNVWFNDVIGGSIIIGILAVFVVGYLAYYFIDRFKERNYLKKKQKDIPFILYGLTFITYFTLPVTAIKGVSLNFFGTVTMTYGFEAIIVTLIICSIIPIFPISIIYQIIYLIKNYKTLSTIKKKIVIYSWIILLLSSIIPCLIYSIYL